MTGDDLAAIDAIGVPGILLSSVSGPYPASRLDNDLYILINNVTRYSTWIGGPN